MESKSEVVAAPSRVVEKHSAIFNSDLEGKPSEGLVEVLKSSAQHENPPGDNQPISSTPADNS